MDKAKSVTGEYRPSDTGLGKTFLIGVATPIVSAACTFSRKERPAWLTKEFMYSSRPLKNIAFGVGLLVGAYGLAGSIYVAGEYILDTYVAPPKEAVKHIEHQTSPRKIIKDSHVALTIIDRQIS